MDFWIENDLLVCLVSTILAGIIIPQILLIAFRKQLFDEIDERKIHKGVVPRLGGIAFMPSILFSTAFVCGMSMTMGHVQMYEALNVSSLGLLFLICAMTMLFLTGIADDLIGVRYRAKFIVQIICGVLVVLGGVEINDFHGLLWMNSLPLWLAVLMTVFIVVFIVNSINLIDGIDGLASGLSMVALVFYGMLMHLGGMHIYSMIAWATLGTLLPFFYYNVFGNPNKRKKIFMGDTGSLTIGIILAFLALAMTHVPQIRIVGRFNPVVLAFSPLIVPAFDVVRVYLHRVINHRNPFLPDRSHIHHKLLALGCPQRVAMIVILLTSALFTTVNILLSPYVEATWLVTGDILVWTVTNILLTRLIRRRENLTGQALYE